MKPIETSTTNLILRSPAGMEGVIDMPSTKFTDQYGYPVIESCWELTAEEVAEVQKTGRIYVSIIANNHPPIKVSNSSSIIVMEGGEDLDTSRD